MLRFSLHFLNHMNFPIVRQMFITVILFAHCKFPFGEVFIKVSFICMFSAFGLSLTTKHDTWAVKPHFRLIRSDQT